MLRWGYAECETHFLAASSATTAMTISPTCRDSRYSSRSVLSATRHHHHQHPMYARGHNRKTFQFLISVCRQKSGPRLTNCHTNMVTSVTHQNSELPASVSMPSTTLPLLIFLISCICTLPQSLYSSADKCLLKLPLYKCKMKGDHALS